MLVTNCSVLFTEYPLLERAKRSAEAGFGSVEFWWPFGGPIPERRDVREFIDSINSAGVTLVAMNLFAGDMTNGDRGVLSHAKRREQLMASLDAVVEIAKETGVGSFNALFGRRVDTKTKEEQIADGLAALRIVAEKLSPVGKVLLEPVSGVPDFPLRTFSDCLDLVRSVCEQGVTNVGVLADLYHMAVNSDDVDFVIDNFCSEIAHVQVADFPGRHEPGTGHLPLKQWTDTLYRSGYTGRVALEYLPLTTTVVGLESLPVL